MQQLLTFSSTLLVRSSQNHHKRTMHISVPRLGGSGNCKYSYCSGSSYTTTSVNSSYSNNRIRNSSSSNSSRFSIRTTHDGAFPSRSIVRRPGSVLGVNDGQGSLSLSINGIGNVRSDVRAIFVSNFSSSSNQNPKPPLSGVPNNADATKSAGGGVSLGNDNSSKSTTDIVEPEQKGGIANTLKGVLKSVVEVVKNPKATWIEIKEVARHYWVSSKLLWSEMKIAKDIMIRVLKGSTLTRRERQQLTRTFGDMLRLIPFAVFVIVPFMEFLLPFALKMFPNMLPSTFTDKLKKEENMKKELHLRLSLAGFLNDTLKEVVMKKTNSEEKSGALEVLSFIEKTRQGVPMSNDTILRMARLFKDELTLANIARPQLMSMCQYMSIKPYGADAFLRYQLRTRLRDIKEDDRRILWDGIDSLTVDELQDACRARGMRSFGLTHFGYKRILQEWLDLSIQKNIPIALLIISRALNLSTNVATTAEEVLKNSISSLTDDTINEVVVENAKQGEEKNIDVQKRKLESIQFQKEMIEVERVESEAAKPPAPTPPLALESGPSKTDTIKTAFSAAVNPIIESVTAAVSSSTGKDKEKEKEREREKEREKESKTSTTAPFDGIMASTMKDAATNLSVPSGSSMKDVAIDISIPRPSEERSVVAAAETSGKTQEKTANEGQSPNAAVSTAEAKDKDKSSASDEKDKEVKAAAAAATVAAPVKSEIKLTVHEMEALGDLARGSSVEREKAEIAILQAQVATVIETVIEAQKVEAAAAAASSNKVAVTDLNATAIVVGGDRAATNLANLESPTPKAPEKAVVVTEEDKNVLRMQSMLAGMLGKLKTQVDVTEKEIGNKLTTLDLDQDGEISSEEFKEALTKILARKPTDAEINEILSVLDVDRDGKVSVVELLQFVESRKMKEEVEVLEEKVKSSQKAHEVEEEAKRQQAEKAGVPPS